MAETLTLNQAHTAAAPPAEEGSSNFANALLSTRMGRSVVGGLAALSFIGAEKLFTDEAHAAASGTVVKATELPPNVTATFRSETKMAHVKVSDIATDRITVLQNISAKGIPQKTRRRLEAQGRCRTFDGTKVKIYTEGYNVNGGRSYGPDERRSRFCKLPNGKWLRVLCNNEAFINVPPPKPPIKGRAIFVNNSASVRVKIHAESTAQAECRSSSGNTYAYGFGHAEKTDYIRLRTLIKTLRNRRTGGANSLAVKLYNSVYAEAKTEAEAKAICHETTHSSDGTPPPPPPENNPPTGRGDVPHRYVNSVDKVCVDPEDPDGDAVTVSNFLFTNTSTGSEVGEIVRPPYYVGSGDVQCVDWRAPEQPQSVTWSADLQDSRGLIASKEPDEFPVLANDTGGN